VHWIPGRGIPGIHELSRVCYCMCVMCVYVYEKWNQTLVECILQELYWTLPLGETDPGPSLALLLSSMKLYLKNTFYKQFCNYGNNMAADRVNE